MNKNLSTVKPKKNRFSIFVFKAEALSILVCMSPFLRESYIAWGAFRGKVYTFFLPCFLKILFIVVTAATLTSFIVNYFRRKFEFLQQIRK